jgi:trimethylamine--corrinoid protein Co-methyltransferase
MGFLTKPRMLKKKDLNRIHEATVRILEETGIVFHSDEVIEIFKKEGARVAGQTVYIPRKMIDRAIDTVPKVFKWHAKDSEKSIYVGEKDDRVHIMLDNGPIYIQTLNGERRLATLQDMSNFYKLGQASEIVDIVGQIPVDPSDAPAGFKCLHAMHHLLRNTDKPLVGIVERRERIEQMFDMLEMAMGQNDYLRDHTAMGVSVCALSPLQYARESCDTILAYARRRQPIMFLTCALAGVSASIHLVRSAILQNAELIGGLVLAQIINPGTSYVYSPASTVANMQNAGYITGPPEANLINTIGLQLANELYHFPTRTMAGMTDSKIVDCQAGYETMQNYFLLMLSGTHLMNECIGTLDSLMTLSYEKFMIDEEMMSRMLRILEGVDVSDASFDISEILAVGHEGSYLMQPETLARCRDLWKPSVSFRNSYTDWINSGEEDVAMRAGRRCKEVLDNCPDNLIGSDLDRDLARYVASRH